MLALKQTLIYVHFLGGTSFKHEKTFNISMILHAFVLISETHTCCLSVLVTKFIYNRFDIISCMTICF